VLDPADDDLLIEIAAQLEQVVIRVPLIDLDQRTCTRRGSTQCESQRCLRSARGLLALLAPLARGWGPVWHTLELLPLAGRVTYEVALLTRGEHLLRERLVRVGVRVKVRVGVRGRVRGRVRVRVRVRVNVGVRGRVRVRVRVRV
jgi:hypothetical protein